MKTKEKILLASYKTFINNGFHGTSMQQLVEATGLSKGAFYHHFKSKSELYEQVIKQYFLSFYKSVDWDSFEEQKLNLQEIEYQIKQFYISFVQKILSITNHQMSPYFVMYFEAFNILPQFKEEVQMFYKKLENLLLNATDNPTHSSKAAITTIAKYEGVLFILATHPNLTIEELLNNV